jgi:two-component system cell cycle sensor histidine kinase/response regulator CckA
MVLSDIYREMVELAGEGLIYQEASGEIKAWNKSAERIFGIKQEEAVGHTSTSRDWKLIYEDGTPCPGDQHPSMITLRTGKPLINQVRGIKRGPDDITWLSINTRPIARQDGATPHAVFISFNDITQRKETDQKLREGEAIYKNLLNGIPDVVMRFDRHGRHLFVSENVVKVVEIAPEDFLGKTHRDLGFPEEMCRYWEEAIARVHDSGVPHEDEFSYSGTRGKRFYNWRLIPETDSDGNIQSVLSIARDITQERRAEKDYQTLFREMTDGFALHEMIYDADGKAMDYRFLAVNPAFECLTGLKAEEVQGRTVLELMPDIEQYWIETYAGVALTGNPVNFENYSQTLDKHYAVHAFRPSAGQFACLFSDITRRKQIEDALIESEANLLDAQRLARMGSWDFEASTSRPTWSPEMFRIFGLDPAEGAPDWERMRSLVHPDDWSALESAVEAAMERAVPYSSEFRIIRLDGEQRWVWNRGQAVKGPGGKVEKLYGTLQDITTRKSAEMELQKSEERYRTLATLSPAGIYQTDSEGHCVYANAAWLAMAGLSLEEALGDGWTSALHPDDKESIGKGWYRMVARGKRWDHEYRFRTPEGKTTWVYGTARPLHDQDGNVEGYLGINININDKIKYQSELKANEAKYRALYDNAPLAYQSLDESGLILDINPAWLRTLGYQKDEVIGKPFKIFLHQDWKPHFEKNFPEFKRRGYVHDVQFKMRHKNGHYRDISFEGCAAYLPDGTFKQTYCVFQDITDQKEAEEEKARLEAQLSQARKMDALGTLASGIAHDFNNILAAIMGYSELARDELPEGHMVRHEIAEIIKAASKAKQLVRQILTFSRKSGAERKAISLNGVLHDAIGIIQRTIPKMISLELDLDEKLQPIMADPQQMEQIIINLVTNGADAVGGAGCLTIATSRVKVENKICDLCGKLYSGEYAMLSVKDTGDGMSPEIIGKIFDPFFTTKAVGKGTGLGLSTVYGVVKGHNGHIACHSQPGQGTEFQILLPLIDEVLIENTKEVQELIESHQAKGTLLVVDDEETIRDIANKILSRSGNEVLLAESGEQALDIYRKHIGAIDGVILDLNMPGMGGLACLGELRKLDAEAKVLIASGYIQYENTNELLAMGAWGMAFKPYRRLELLDKVHKMLSAKA